MDYDARIICGDATTGTTFGTATMTIIANIINLNPLSTINLNAVGNVKIGSETSTNTFII